uniref:Uncharacterized protein n=1 Tax=Leersia perrieri TaxID=77586 RepID=A0A0D9VVM1_9ORYZ
MSRYLKQYEKEHMKMAMLKQEETFKHQVQELHRLYQVQKLLMTAGSASSATTMAGGIMISCRPEDEENEAGSSRRPWDAYNKQQAPTHTVVEESELELTLGIGSFAFGTAGEANAAKEAPSSSVDSRTSNSSSSTESGSPNCRATPHHKRPSRLGSSSVAGSGVGSSQQHLELEHDALKQPPWLHQCLNLAR